MISNRIPGGLIRGGEFLQLNNRPHYITAGAMVGFWETPENILNKLRDQMNSMPVVKAAMEHLVGGDEDVQLEQFAMCRYGALNNDPDVDDQGNLSHAEYVPCIKRGSCKVEGVGCSSIMVREGIFLTKAETEVFKLVLWPDRIIAVTLGLSELTVKTHWKNIRTKMDLQSKLQIVHWSTQRGII
ncbi:MAG: helix-turn-helix transcriptional regulator [Pedobacter sp.]|nr:helix-turn-helix transcriptional regulator [Pedobacter sp.]